VFEFMLEFMFDLMFEFEFMFELVIGVEIGVDIGVGLAMFVFIRFVLLAVLFEVTSPQAAPSVPSANTAVSAIFFMLVIISCLLQSISVLLTAKNGCSLQLKVLLGPIATINIAQRRVNPKSSIPVEYLRPR
jgi:hypothetical protein